MSLVIFGLYFLLIFGSVLRPKLFVYVVFLLGPLPVGSLLRHPAVATPIGEIHINALIVFAILVASAFGLLVRAQDTSRQAKKIWLFLAFFGFATLSMGWSADLGMAVRMMFKLVAPVAFMLFIAINIGRIGIPTLLRAVVLSGVVYAVATILSWGLGLTLNHEFGLPATSRAVTSGHLLAPVSVLFAELATKPGVVRLILALFLTGTLLAGFTRITIAGLFGSVSIAFFLRLKGFARVALPVLGVLGFIALFTLVGQFRERMFLNRADQFSFTTVLEDPSRAVEAIGGSGRYLAWNIAFNRLFKPNPLLGSGVGSAQLMFVDQGGAQISAVHSEVLRLLCDVGIVGFALYVLAWVQLFWLTRRRLRESQNGPLRTVATAAMAAGTAYLIFMLTDNGFDYVSQIGVFVYGLIGATIGSRAEPTRGARPETERKPAEPEKKPAPAELARSRPRQ